MAHTLKSIRRSPAELSVVLIGLLILGYGVLLAVFAESPAPAVMHVGPWPNLYDKPIGEDGFYALLVAWNLAADGTLSQNAHLPVTGIQPLFVFVLALIAKLVRWTGGDKEVFARWCVIFSVCLHLGCAYAVSRLVPTLVSVTIEQARAAAALCAALWLLSFYQFTQATYGLETPLYIILVSMIVSLTFDAARQCRPGRSTIEVTRVQQVYLGALIGAACLTRIDFLVVAAAFGAFGVATGRLPVSSVLLPLVIAIAMVTPWFWYVIVVSGTAMPSSGSAQNVTVSGIATLIDRAIAMGASLVQQLCQPIYIAANGTALVGAMLWAASSAIAAWRVRIGRHLRHPDVLRLWLLSLGPLAVYYVVFSWASHFYTRYMALVAIFSAPVLACVLVMVLPRRIGLVAAGAAALFVTFCSVSYHQGMVGSNHAVTARYVRDHLPRDARVGASQSGVVGYVNDNVINLDGKLTFQLLPYLANGDMSPFLREFHIDYIVDWGPASTWALPAAELASHWTPCELPINNGVSICMKRVDSLR